MTDWLKTQQVVFADPRIHAGLSVRAPWVGLPLVVLQELLVRVKCSIDVEPLLPDLLGDLILNLKHFFFCGLASKIVSLFYLSNIWWFLFFLFFNYLGRRVFRDVLVLLLISLIPLQFLFQFLLIRIFKVQYFLNPQQTLLKSGLALQKNLDLCVFSFKFFSQVGNYLIFFIYGFV